MAFVPLEAPFGYAFEVIDHIEERNCSRGYGCLHGAELGTPDWIEPGPGGYCGLLAQVSLGDEPIEEMDMDAAGRVTCRSYEARPTPPPPPRPGPVAEPIPEGQLTLDLGVC